MIQSSTRAIWFQHCRVTWSCLGEALFVKILNGKCINTLRSRQNGRYFADDIFKCIFLNENAWISLKISLKFVLKVRIDNIPALVQIMAWRRPGDKPLSELMMVSLLAHICVTQPQWVKSLCDCHKQASGWWAQYAHCTFTQIRKDIAVYKNWKHYDACLSKSSALVFDSALTRRLDKFVLIRHLLCIHVTKA